MIVLDEQLNEPGLREEIERWYRGAVKLINDLRPESQIKDSSIATLLRNQSSPTFVTIDEAGFWKTISAGESYCAIVICVPSRSVREVPGILRETLKLKAFNTKKKRMGKVVRVTKDEIRFYDSADMKIKTVDP
ncbi:MAG: hypothetical protein NUW37_18165 [Planctomycetes bacterium]|nr:hypothetical protein [Planctomycetota bacterium]